MPTAAKKRNPPIRVRFIMMKDETGGLSRRMRFSRSLLSHAALFLSLACLTTAAASAQLSYLKNSDVSVGAFGQFTPTVTGNGITDRPNDSLGAQAAFRHTYHWWLGYEGSYDYTRFSEYYSTQRFPVQHNTHEFAGSYLVTLPSVWIHPFAFAGVSALVFSPSLNGGQNFSWQGESAFNFGAGINQAILTSHLGLRFQYRGVYAKAPDFNDAILKTGKSRLMSEPVVGVYFKF